MTNEFIYNIKNIFSDNMESVFHSTKTKTFYIGPYQRSFKWKSEEQFDQVPQLLNDVYDAWQNSPNAEYFLQYITVKADTEKQWLEVIDGQQRLTTLSLIFYQLGELKEEYNIAVNKLIYSRYDNGNIFDEVCDYCREHNKVNDKDFDSQDKYYMASASLYIKKRLDEWEKSGLNDIVTFLLNNVKIIVNIESNFVQSEEIFANLNDNHVPLTDAYLIKGLLITNAVSRVNSYGRSLEYTEIQEKRKNLGRTWDEIQTWITHAQHSHFFFKHTKIGANYSRQYSMEYLLELALLYQHKKERSKVVGDYSENRLILFNKYNSIIKSNEDAITMIETICHIYHKMVTIYKGSLYNLWGYVQFCKNIGNNEYLDIYSCLNKSEKEIKKYLIELCIRRIPNLCDEINSKDNYKALRYASRNEKLTNLLLSFSVFLPMKESNDFKFGFYDYDEGAKWSFEHISPQNPKGAITIPTYSQMYVIKELNKKINLTENDEEKNKLECVKDNIMNDRKIDSNDIDFLFDQTVDEHSLGNMALLSREDNSANNNNPFMIKKLIIQNRKGNGAFIPNHTFEVFNKILVSPEMDKPFSAESFIWNQNDIDAHIQWMNKYNSIIINWLKEKMNI